jgi:hypothetical protein
MAEESFGFIGFLLHGLKLHSLFSQRHPLLHHVLAIGMITRANIKAI